MIALPFYVYTPHLFANPVVDVFRMVCVILAALMIMVSVRVVWHQHQTGVLLPGQLARFVFLWLAGLSIAYTEIIVQGTALTWRLPLNLIALAFGLYGVLQTRRGQHR